MSKRSTKVLMILLITLAASGCGDQDLPPFPDIQLCKVVWAAEPYCRCVRVADNSKSTHPKEYCNLSIPNGHWAMMMDYVKELERRLKKSYKKPLTEARESMLQSYEHLNEASE